MSMVSQTAAAFQYRWYSLGYCARAMAGQAPIGERNAIAVRRVGILFGGGEADDSFAGAVRESVTDVRTELGLDGAEAGKSFVATAGAFQ
jgi:hypothetical protein